MLFKRKKPLTIFQKVRQMIWPPMGWRRTFSYLKVRILRLPASTHSIAMGMAAGCAVSWTPTFGLHLVQCFLFSVLFRANFFGAMVGSLIGNPWTFPAMMWVSYQVGYLLMSLVGLEQFIAMDADLSLMTNFSETPFRIFLPMLVGGYVLALGTFPLFYFPAYSIVKAGRRAQKVLLEKRILKNKVEKEKS